MAASLITLQNKPTSGTIVSLVNGASNGSWDLAIPTISHTNDIGSYTNRSFSSLTIGNTYRVTYTIETLDRCAIRMLLGNNLGTMQTVAGTYTDTLILTGPNKTLQFYSNGLASISYYKIEELQTTIVDHPLDKNDMINQSWTLSFNPILNQWISFHSYLPNNYLLHPSKLLVKENSSQIMLNNSGDFGKYFDEDVKPFIVETIFNEYKTDTKVFDNVTVIMESSNDEVFTNTFFDQGIVYTENQCSGLISFNIGENVTRKEKNWNFNKFLDITNNLSQKIFVSDWDSISTNYPIDKVVNINKIDDSKPWYQRGRMRDKYLAVRFISNNFDNSKLICKFVISSFRASQR